MENKVKSYIEKEYELSKKYCKSADSVRCAINRCYGIIMFALNELFDDPNYNLNNWWDDKMLPKFRKLEREKEN